MSSFSNTMRKIVGKRSGRITKRWHFDTHAELLVPPIITDLNNNGEQEIIVGTTQGELIVLNAQAQELWRYNIHENTNSIDAMFIDQDVINSINAPPAIEDLYKTGKKNVVFGSEAGILYCLDSKGALLWKFETEAGIRGSPLISDVNEDGELEIVFGATDKHLYILNKEGKLLEKFEQESSIESTPGFFNGLIVFGTEAGKIVALTAGGELKWSYQTGAKITAAPTFARLSADMADYVIIGSTDNILYCLDVDGELVWTYETGGAIYSQAAVADLNNDHKLEILIGSCDNNIHAITAEGEKYWTYETDFWVMGTPLVADIDGDGKLEVIAGSYDHYLYILDSEGTYMLDYVPGLSGVVQQAGHYSDIMTQEPGQHVGKKIWQYKTEGVIVGCSSSKDQKRIIVSTKSGIIDDISHQE